MFSNTVVCVQCERLIRALVDWGYLIGCYGCVIGVSNITGVYGYDNAANRWMSLIKCIIM